MINNASSITKTVRFIWVRYGCVKSNMCPFALVEVRRDWLQDKTVYKSDRSYHILTG